MKVAVKLLKLYLLKILWRVLSNQAVAEHEYVFYGHKLKESVQVKEQISEVEHID